MADHEEMSTYSPAANVASTDRFVCGVVEGFYGRPWTTDQRKDLFSKISKMGLNSYLYAPKDDSKHRMYWRELYSVEEAETMKHLIQSAKENGISFYYAISPGIDIVYSSSKDVASLKRKLDQVTQLGCDAFALLFDDIDPEMCETDKEIFQSVAHAQVSVSNEIYQHLNNPKFMFCPTEYCATRAIPNVMNSEYLNTIGNKLLPDIDIMWTGPKVISEIITPKSIQELTEVFRRPPVIWDNIHANDYDQRRLFLGPYSGRSPELIPLLRGVMTNPNCEYETNFIALHTLAQWSKSSVDGKRDLSSNTDPVSADIKLETQSEDGSSVEDIPDQFSPEMYHPRQALKLAISDWISEFQTPKSADSKPSVAKYMTPVMIPENGIQAPVPIVPTCMVVTPTTQTAAMSQLPLPVPPIPNIAENVDPLAIEPMDCYPTPPQSSSPSKAKPGGLCPPNTCSVEVKDSEMCEPDVRLKDVITYEDLCIIVDMFYLPYEHGNLGLQIMQEFQWLKANANCMVPKSRKHGEEVTPEMEEWMRRAAKFNDLNKSVSAVFTKLLNCQNRCLLYDIYPYFWDIKGVISLLNSYVNWLGFRKGYKDPFNYAEQEAWVFRGGLTGELQRLLPLEGAQDLFVYKVPEQPVNKIFTIRPLLPDDKDAVYRACIKTSNDGEDGSMLYTDFPEIISDKLVGGLMVLSPEFCFVIEDEDGICGYALAAVDAQQFFKKQEIAWLPELCSKYPLKDNLSAPVKELINGFNNYKSTPLPEVIMKHHPSLLRINILPSVLDCSVPKRLLACAMSALKANGSCGVFTEISMGDKQTFEFYNRLGFLQVSLAPGSIPNDTIYLGRNF